MGISSSAPSLLPLAAAWFPIILDHVRATAYVRDRAGRLVYVNRHCETVLGLPRAELLGKTNAELFPSDARALDTNDERIWTTGQAEEIVEHFVVDGESRTFISHKFPLRDGTGAIAAVAGISVDMTDRARAEGGLRRERALTQRIVDSVGDGILAFDTDCRYTLWNPEMERISGVPANTVLGKRAFDVFPFLVETGEDKCFHEALAGRKCHSTEQRFDVPESGRSGIFEGEYSPLHDANDEIVGGIAIIRDVTQRRVEEENRLRIARSEAARTEAEAAARRFAFLAEAGEILASSLDYEQTLGTLARLAVDVLGDMCIVDVVEEGRLRRVGLVHVRPEKTVLLEELRRRFAPTATSPQPAARVLRDGKAEVLSVVDAEVIAQHCVDAEHADIIRRIGMRSHLAVPLYVRGTLIGVMSLAVTESDRRYGDADLALATDLARRAAAAVENARLYERLREEDRRKDEFLATLAHELRNPLAPVRTGLDVLRAAAKDDPSTASVRATMERQIGHMTRLIDDLLDVSRISHGKVQLVSERIDVAHLVQSALETSGPTLDAARLRLEVRLPAEGTAVMVDGDRMRLSQVLSNLLNNAAKFTPAGGVVRIAVEGVGADAEVRISDTGVGMDSALLTRAFEMFVQGGAPPSGAQGGLGIGLTLVRRLVELHGGQVWGESEGPTRGSTFVVRLPRAKPGEDQRAPAIAPPDRPPASPTPRRILVVDDNVDAARMLVKLLEMDHHVVHRAASGQEALAIVKDFQPEVALLDIGLPGISGLDLARAFRADPSLEATVLVAMTGWGQDEDRHRSFAAGFDHHLTKPTDARELTAIIESLARRHRDE